MSSKGWRVRTATVSKARHMDSMMYQRERPSDVNARRHEAGMFHHLEENDPVSLHDDTCRNYGRQVAMLISDAEKR